MGKPHFIIKNKFQKRPGLYEAMLTPEILSDVCFRITGHKSYTVEFDNTGYNIGRLATLEYKNTINYVSFSEVEVKSRNSSFQSFSSALTRYHQEAKSNKRIYFYFLASTGNIETDYFVFMYRLMKTAGTVFLNESESSDRTITPFSSVEDISANKKVIRGRNRGNNSTYLTKNEEGAWQIYGKTYGANKYETTLLCLAISEISTSKIELFEIQEGSLTSLPESAREVILALGKIVITTSDLTLERQEFESNDSLRSPAFIYNLLEKFGDKKCALCDCEIPQLIQGAHIWPVATIKREASINQKRKLEAAVDGDNGIWLCNNHHKLFDVDLILINEEGRVKYNSNLRENDENYVCDVTVNGRLPEKVLTSGFLAYLQKRNSPLDANRYSYLQ